MTAEFLVHSSMIRQNVRCGADFRRHSHVWKKNGVINFHGVIRIAVESRIRIDPQNRITALVVRFSWNAFHRRIVFWKGHERNDEFFLGAIGIVVRILRIDPCWTLPCPRLRCELYPSDILYLCFGCIDSVD